AGGRIVDANARIERDYGYARVELLGKSIEILLPERLRGAHGAHRAHFGAHAHAYRAMGAGRQLVARRKDGREVPVEIGLSAVDDDVIAAFIVDVSERERGDAALRES